MRKKVAELTAALLAALCLLSAPALAAERTEDKPPVEVVAEAETAEWSLSEPAADHGELFAAYVNQCFYGNAASPLALKDPEGDRLAGLDQKLYDALKRSVKSVAESGGGTGFTVSCSELDLKTSWTSEDLDGAAVMTGGEVNPAAAAAVLDRVSFNIHNVLNALLADLPYELYWFDAAADSPVIYSSPRLLLSPGGERESPALLLDGDFHFTFSIAQEYQDSGGEAVKPEVAAVKTAVRNAQAVIAAHEGKNDYQKLLAFKEELRALAGPGGGAASGGAFGDPWQMVWVFDGDPGTKAACEGYSKAFQYLCDASGLQSAECCTVSGLMQENNALPKSHMWNIVQLDGKNYLADISGSLPGGAGRDGGLFLAGAEAYRETTPAGLTVTLPSGPVHYWYEEGESDRLDGTALSLAETNFDPKASPAYAGDAPLTEAGAAAVNAAKNAACLLAAVYSGDTRIIRPLLAG